MVGDPIFFLDYVCTYEPGWGKLHITYLLQKSEILEKLSHLFRLKPRIIHRKKRR